MSGNIIKIITPEQQYQQDVINSVPIRPYNELSIRRRITVACIYYILDGLLGNELGGCNTRLIELNNEYNSACRNVGNLMFDLPSVYTGLASVGYNSLSGKAKRTLGTMDHIVPRQHGGDILLRGFMDEKITSKSQLWEFIFHHKLVHVNQILRSENNKLRRTIPTYTNWQIGYDQENIIVEPVRRAPRSKS